MSGRIYRPSGSLLRSSGPAARLALLFFLIDAASASAAGGPWRFGAALKAPSWLQLEGSLRVRFEALSSNVRPGREGSDESLVERLLFAARFGGDKWLGKLEFEDSRAFLELGATHLFPGGFLRTRMPSLDDTTYGYLQTTFTF